MKLTVSQLIPKDYDRARWVTIVGKVENEFNLLQGGALAGRYYSTAAPTTGNWARGDIVYNSAPSAGGTIGWVCVSAGTPGTWKTWGSIAA